MCAGITNRKFNQLIVTLCQIPPFLKDRRKGEIDQGYQIYIRIVLSRTLIIAF